MAYESYDTHRHEWMEVETPEGTRVTRCAFCGVIDSVEETIKALDRVRAGIGEMVDELEAVPLLSVRVGLRVKAKVMFSGVPEGTEGVIDELYEGGFMVAWDLPDAPLPPGYSEYDGKPAILSRILRDGFEAKELEYLSQAFPEKRRARPQPRMDEPPERLIDLED